MFMRSFSKIHVNISKKSSEQTDKVITDRQATPASLHQYKEYMSQCMTKGGLWHDSILVRTEWYDVIAVYFSIYT